LLAKPVERKYISPALPVLSRHAGYSTSGMWRLRSYPPKSNVIPMGLHSAVRVPLAAFALSGILALPALAQPERERDLESLITRHAVWDPADFIMQKLATHRVVMIGDAGHGDPLYYRLVVASLNRWVSAFEGKQQNDVSRGLTRRLILALEMDSTLARHLNDYIRGGDILDFIAPGMFWGEQFTSGTLAFYDQLRALELRIDEHNRALPQSEHIRLDVVGPEMVIDLTAWTPAKRDSFFVYARDEYSASRLKEVMASAPDAKLMVYYGNGHLIRGTVQKAGDQMRGMGKYLAEYLTVAFANDGGVYTCGQADARRATWLDDAIVRIGRTFAIDQSFLRGCAISPDASFEASDGSVYEFVPRRNARHISGILSERLVDYAIAHLGECTDSANYFIRGNLLVLFNYLCMAAPSQWASANVRNLAAVDSTISAWKSWRGTAHVDIVKDVASLDYFKRFVDLIRNSPDPASTLLQRRLAVVTGFKVWFHSGASPQERADSLWACIVRYRRPLVVENLIHLLWIGSETEKRNAVAVLREETGENYTTAGEWAKWWETRPRQ